MGSSWRATRSIQQGKRVRLYTEPGLANVIGSVSGLGIGISGLEHTYNGRLLGLESVNASYNRMLHLPVSGDDLILTIDSELQRKAEEALGARAGSITGPGCAHGRGPGDGQFPLSIPTGSWSRAIYRT